MEREASPVAPAAAVLQPPEAGHHSAENSALDRSVSLPTPRAPGAPTAATFSKAEIAAVLWAIVGRLGSEAVLTAAQFAVPPAAPVD